MRMFILPHVTMVSSHGKRPLQIATSYLLALVFGVVSIGYRWKAPLYLPDLSVFSLTKGLLLLKTSVDIHTAEMWKFPRRPALPGKHAKRTPRLHEEVRSVLNVFFIAHKPSKSWPLPGCSCPG
jgi:hypothetical protein